MIRARAVVVGAGIAGLAAAHRLAGIYLGEVLVLEASDRPGGKIAPVELAGLTVEGGPDSFVTRNPVGVQLCQDLGLADQLLAPAPLGALLWVRGRLRPLPREMAPGIPIQMRRLARSGLVSGAGALRAALERLVPVDATASDLSIGAIVERRFGKEVMEAITDPLLGGIHAGDVRRLSAESVAPHLVEVLRRGRPLSSLKIPIAPDPAFVTLRGGLGQLVEALVSALPAAGSLRLGTRAVAVTPAKSGYRVTLSSNHEVEAQAVVLATPPHVTAALLPFGPVAELLARIDSVSVATVVLAYPGRVRLPSATGFLVPRRERRLLVGCTFLSQKWPHLADNGLTLIRCAVGSDGDTRWQELDDDQLVLAVRSELRTAIGLQAEPEAAAVSRFPDALPQYRVGHSALIRAIHSGLAQLPGLTVAGAAYQGIGLPACIASGQRAADVAAPAMGTAIA